MQWRTENSPLEAITGSSSATSKNIVVSADGGATWKPAGATLPHESDFTYSATTKTFYIWNGGCMTSGWDYEAN